VVRAILPKDAREATRRWAYRLLALFLWGRGLTCPICRHRYRRFATYVTDPSYHNRLCPWCLSLERHRLLWLYLKDKTEIFSKPIRLLHLAPEYPLYRAFLASANIRYITGGLDAAFIRVEMDLVRIPCKDNLFDVIICNHVLEHILDDVAAMGELHRVLKPGGQGFLQSPLDYNRAATFEDPQCLTPEDRARAFGQSDHVRIYGLDYKDRLEEAGFTVRVDEYAKTLAPAIIHRYGLIAAENLYICTK
jgi:SAM-dependent methyltransferase